MFGKISHFNLIYLYTNSKDVYNYLGLKDKGYTRDIIGSRGARWMLRSPSIDGWNKCLVDYTGYAGDYIHTYVSGNHNVVRPTLYINTGSVNPEPEYPKTIQYNYKNQKT